MPPSHPSHHEVTHQSRLSHPSHPSHVFGSRIRVIYLSHASGSHIRVMYPSRGGEGGGEPGPGAQRRRGSRIPSESLIRVSHLNHTYPSHAPRKSGPHIRAPRASESPVRATGAAEVSRTRVHNNDGPGLRLAGPARGTYRGNALYCNATGARHVSLSPYI